MTDEHIYRYNKTTVATLVGRGTNALWRRRRMGRETQLDLSPLPPAPARRTGYPHSKLKDYFRPDRNVVVSGGCDKIGGVDSEKLILHKTVTPSVGLPFLRFTPKSRSCMIHCTKLTYSHRFQFTDLHALLCLVCNE